MNGLPHEAGILSLVWGGGYSQRKPRKAAHLWKTKPERERESGSPLGLVLSVNMCLYNFKNKNRPEKSRTDQTETESYNIHKGETEQRIFNIYSMKNDKRQNNTTAKFIFCCFLWINSVRWSNSLLLWMKYNNYRLQRVCGAICCYNVSSWKVSNCTIRCWEKHP